MDENRIKPNGNILLAAHALVNGKRQDDYGPPRECLGMVSELWSVFLKRHTTPAEVAGCMILMKLVRESFSHSPDNWLDIAGYAGIGADLAGSPWPPDKEIQEDIPTADDEQETHLIKEGTS